MYEGELTKLDGQQIMLDKQKLTIQSTMADVDVVNTLKQANQAIGAANKKMDVDTIADLQEEMEENMAEVQERQDLFMNVAEEGKDDMMAELDELEAEALAGELEGMQVGAMPIAAPANPIAQPAAAAGQSEEER